MREKINIKLSDEDMEDAKGKLRWARVEEILFEHKWNVLLVLLGLLFIGAGVFLFRAGVFKGDKIEIIDQSQETPESASEVLVEISGAVEKPGVYRILASERVERLLIEAGGVSVDADREWVEKNLNRAAKLADGQKIYIPHQGELGIRNYELGGKADNSPGAISRIVNINTATLSDLDKLPGIGTVRAQAIIDNRPYSSVNDLLSKKAVPASVFEKIKEQITAP